LHFSNHLQTRSGWFTNPGVIVTSINRLHPDTLRALKGGRALVLLGDYRHPILPDHTFTVVGFLDTGGFEGTLIPDEDPDCDLARMELPLGPHVVTATFLESADARAVHALWSAWHTGVRADYMRFIEFIAEVLRRDRLDKVMRAIPSDGEHSPGGSGRASRHGHRRSRDSRRSKQ
jgi:hypothetical protein